MGPGLDDDACGGMSWIFGRCIARLGVCDTKKIPSLVPETLLGSRIEVWKLDMLCSTR